MLKDKYSGDLYAFKNFDEYSNDKKVQKITFQLWSEYITNYDPVENDKIKAKEKNFNQLKFSKNQANKFQTLKLLKLNTKIILRRTNN